MNIYVLSRRILILVVFFARFPGVAHAHTIGGNGFSSGITHPFIGLDHLLAMVAVGILSTQNTEKTLWHIPVIFVFSMIGGGIVGFSGVSLPLVETGIALSVLLAGIAICVHKRLPMRILLTCVVISAFFHGFAHGEEIPIIANPLWYKAGFVLSTIILHATGILVGTYSKKSERMFGLVRISGVTLFLAGVYFLL